LIRFQKNEPGVCQAREENLFTDLRQPGCLDAQRTCSGRPMALRPRLSTGLPFQISFDYIIATGRQFLPFISAMSVYRIATARYSLGRATTNRRPQLALPSAAMQVWKTRRCPPTYARWNISAAVMVSFRSRLRKELATLSGSNA